MDQRLSWECAEDGESIKQDEKTEEIENMEKSGRKARALPKKPQAGKLVRAFNVAGRMR